MIEMDRRVPHFDFQHPSFRSPEKARTEIGRVSASKDRDLNLVMCGRRRGKSLIFKLRMAAVPSRMLLCAHVT